MWLLLMKRLSRIDYVAKLAAYLTNRFPFICRIVQTSGSTKVRHGCERIDWLGVQMTVRMVHDLQTRVSNRLQTDTFIVTQHSNDVNLFSYSGNQWSGFWSWKHLTEASVQLVVQLLAVYQCALVLITICDRQMSKCHRTHRSVRRKVFAITGRKGNQAQCENNR